MRRQLLARWRKLRSEILSGRLKVTATPYPPAEDLGDEWCLHERLKPLGLEAPPSPSPSASEKSPEDSQRPT
jgi:hypothetical protein